MTGDSSSVAPKRDRFTGFEQPVHRDPKEVDCEWCGEPSVKAVPVKRSPGTYMYVCARHVETAERANTPAPRK